MRRLDAELVGDFASQVVLKSPQIPRRERQRRRQVRRILKLFNANEMKLQKPRGPRVDVDINVWERHVDEHDLRIGRRHGLDRDAVVLLLIDQLDAVRHIGLRITEIRRVINQNRAHSRAIQTHQRARRAQRGVDLIDWPITNLIDGREDRQPLGVPRIDHLLHGDQRVLRCGCRRGFAFSQNAIQA